MWKHHGIEPEVFDYSTNQVKSAGYPLRPEIVESTYYLYHYTKDAKYLRMGEQLWKDFVKHCRTDEGYAALKSVVTKEKSDSMQSFLFAETFKYFYLLFAPPNTLDFNQVVFNTEAHPIRRTWATQKRLVTQEVSPSPSSLIGCNLCANESIPPYRSARFDACSATAATGQRTKRRIWW